MPSLGNLIFKIFADISQATASLKRLEDQVKTTSKNLGSIGGTLAGAFSVAGLAELARQAIVSSAKLESSFLRIKNLTGTSAGDIQKYKNSLKSISVEVGQPIQALADGLYGVTSAGLTGAAAIETLAISAKASAVGMGETATIAKTISAVLNAYGKENISAAESAKILFNTTKFGAVDIAELAPAMGQIIGVSSALGVKLEQVGGFVAALSLQGINASEAVTSLRSILDAIINPSEQAAAALAEAGLSMEQVREAAKKDFAGALKLVTDAFKGNETAISKWIGRKEGIIGVLGVTGDKFQRYSEILNQVTLDTTSFDKATQEALNSSEVRWAKFTSEIANKGLAFGDFLKRAVLLAWDLDEALQSIGLKKLNTDEVGALNSGLQTTFDLFQKLGGVPALSKGGPRLDTDPFKKSTKDPVGGIKIISNEELARVDLLRKSLEEILDIATKLNNDDTFFEKGSSVLKAERAGDPTDVPALLPQKLLIPEEGISKVFEKLKASNEEFQNSLKNTNEDIGAIGSAAVSAFSNLAGSLLDGSLAFKDLGRAALQAASQIIKAALAEALAAGIAKSIKNNPNILVGIAIAGVAVAAILSLFKSKVPKLAKGGLAFGPQLALVGDNPNAGRDPEVIAPLSRLQGLLRLEIFKMTDVLASAFNASLNAVQFQEPISPAALQSLEFNPPPSEINVVGRIDGTDIMLVVDRNEAFKKRRNG